MLQHADIVADGLKAEVEVHEDGDLIVRGYAATFSPDEQDEAFEEKAFDEAIDDFMARDRPLLYHHNGTMQLGQVTKLEKHDGKGLYMEAVVPRPADGTELMNKYLLAKRGMLRGLSVAGKFFRRANDNRKAAHDAAVKIYKARLREISLTPIPVNAESLATVSQKAFDDPEVVRELTAGDRAAIGEAVERYLASVRRIEGVLEARAAAEAPPVE